MKAFTTTFLALFLSSYSHPKKIDNSPVLFKVTRSKDKNQITYSVNQDVAGNLQIANPIDIYWIKYENGPKREPLTWIQEKYAYGLTFSKKEKDIAKFKFVSYSKRELTLKKINTSEFKILCQINGTIAELNKVYVKINGGTFWVPKVEYVELNGLRFSDKAPVSEKIIPD
ncbi:MAG: DUF4833 domain-containing protein [Bacteroidetes bacterium]|nr:DUF4833 domain-containing protein [Bacteroidota bacterium]